MLTQTALTRVAPFCLVLVFSMSASAASDSDAHRLDRNLAATDVPGPVVPVVPTSELRVSSGMLPVKIDGRQYELETLTVEPPGPGPFPVAVISHGQSRKPQRLLLRRHLPFAKDFARRGYKAVVFARRGYASSTGDVVDRLGREPFAAGFYVRPGRAAAEDYAGVIEALARRPEIDGTKVIAAGQSGGGFAVTALASEPPPGLIAFVNVSGGRGRPRDYVNHNEDGLVAAFAEFGRTARIPALWLYSVTDRFFWPALVERMFTAYADAGAPVRLDWTGPLWFSGDGHRLMSLGGRELWRPRISAFLKAIGAPNWDRDPGDAAVVFVRPPESLKRNGRWQWLRYLATAGHKAFAVGVGGKFSWAGAQESLDRAKGRALKRCNARGGPCRIVSVNGRDAS